MLYYEPMDGTNSFSCVGERQCANFNFHLSFTIGNLSCVWFFAGVDVCEREMSLVSRKARCVRERLLRLTYISCGMG